MVNAAIAGVEMNRDFKDLLMRLIHLSPATVGLLLMIYEARRFNLRSGVTGSHPALGWRILLSPRGLSRWFFTPRGVYDTEDRLIGLLGFARTVLGVTAVGVVIARYNAASLALLPGHLVIQGINGAVVGTTVVVIAAAVLAGTAWRRTRWTVGKAVLRPLLTCGWLWLLVALLLAVGRHFHVQFRDANVDIATRDLGFVAGWILAFVGPWMAIFLMFSAFYAARHVCNTGDAHPLLPGMLASIIIWLMWLMEVFRYVGISVPSPMVGDMVNVPPTTGLVVGLVGAITVTGLSVWEASRLRRAGWSFRPETWR
ncbi:MAG: hypothetical protein ACRDRV_10270 [Pseudonocardiaceae bacterium]